MSTFEISKSSLISLKAEILRKQNELKKAESGNLQKIKAIKKKTLELKNKKIEDEVKNNVDVEEVDILELSRSQLEAKAKLYEKLSGQSSDVIKNKYLVRFDEKEKTSVNDSEDLPPDDTEEQIHDSDDDYSDSADDWVEYTDCLGRSRKCLRKDLEYFKTRDVDLQERVLKKSDDCVEREQKNASLVDEKDVTQEEPNKDENLEMLSIDMRREFLRNKWEEEENELRNKDNIHYQNVLFDEARQHGVGYYAFSKDEKERLVQQEELKKLRVKTDLEQKKNQELRRIRENKLALRMQAARNRRRARLGLPPEEPAENDGTIATSEDNDETDESKYNPIDIEKEQRAAELRKKHVRPWDIGKEGVVAPREVMSQEEWNEMKRQERVAEFAPPKSNKYYSSGDGTKRKHETHYDGNKFKMSKAESNYNIDEFRGNNDRKTLASHSSNSSKQDLVNEPQDMMKAIEAGLKFLRKQTET